MKPFRRRPLTCKEVVELVTEYLEGEMSRSDRRRFDGHLSECPHCREFLLQMRTTIAVSGQLSVDDLTPDLQEDFTALFRDWKSESPR